jgi:hypothetical protein
MNSVTIALYDTRKREKTTLPPPPADDPIAELEARERKYAHRASRALERARECRAMIDLLRGQALDRAARHAIESGCVDSDDPRHPNHPLHCSKPCCRRSEP